MATIFFDNCIYVLKLIWWRLRCVDLCILWLCINGHDTHDTGCLLKWIEGIYIQRMAKHGKCLHNTAAAPSKSAYQDVQTPPWLCGLLMYYQIWSRWCSSCTTKCPHGTSSIFAFTLYRIHEFMRDRTKPWLPWHFETFAFMPQRAAMSSLTMATERLTSEWMQRQSHFRKASTPPQRIRVPIHSALLFWIGKV